MSKENKTCYALMPFDGLYDFVLDAVKQAAVLYKNDLNASIDVTRADEYLETKKNKVDEIKQRIAKCDFCVIDYSGLRPNTYNKGEKDQRDITTAERKFSRAFENGSWLDQTIIDEICQQGVAPNAYSLREKA